MTECANGIRDRWIYFDHTLKFKDGVPLEEIIAAFAHPAALYVKENYPVLAVALPADFIWMMIFTAVLESKTHDVAEANNAFAAIQRRLGLRFE